MFVCFYTSWSNYIGGFDFDNGETNIEMYMANKEQEAKENDDTNDLVKRVNRKELIWKVYCIKERNTGI